jgi:hypothetical protein
MSIFHPISITVSLFLSVFFSPNNADESVREIKQEDAECDRNVIAGNLEGSLFAGKGRN